MQCPTTSYFGTQEQELGKDKKTPSTYQLLKLKNTHQYLGAWMRYHRVTFGVSQTPFLDAILISFPLYRRSFECGTEFPSTTLCPRGAKYLSVPVDDEKKKRHNRRARLLYISLGDGGSGCYLLKGTNLNHTLILVSSVRR